VHDVGFVLLFQHRWFDLSIGGDLLGGEVGLAGIFYISHRL